MFDMCFCGGLYSICLNVEKNELESVMQAANIQTINSGAHPQNEELKNNI